MFSLLVLLAIVSGGPAAAQTMISGTFAAGAPQNSGACNVATDKCYFPNIGRAAVTVIDGSAGTVTIVPVATVPFGVGIDLAMNRIYVTSSSNGNLYVIDGTTDTLNATVSIASTSSLGFPAVDPTTHYVYVPDTANGALIAVDGTTVNGITAVYATYAAGPDSISAAVNPVTHKVYVSNPGNAATPGNVSVFYGYGAQGPASAVSFITNLSGTPYSLTNQPYYIAVNPVTNKVYITNGYGVMEIDGATDSVIGTYGVGMSTMGIAVDPVTNKVFVGGSSLTRIDASLSNVASLTPGPAYFPAVNPATGQVYAVGYSSSNSVFVYSEQTSTLATLTSPAGLTQPHGVAVNPISNTAFVSYAGTGSNSVAQISGNVPGDAPGSPVSSGGGITMSNPVLEPYNPTTAIDNNIAYVQSGGTTAATAPYLYAIPLPATAHGPVGTMVPIQLTGGQYTSPNVCRPISARINPSVNRAYFRISCSTGYDGVAYVDTSTNTFPGTTASPWAGTLISTNPSAPTALNGGKYTGWKVCGLEINPVTDAVFALLKTGGTNPCQTTATSAEMVTISGATGAQQTPVALGTNATNSFGVDAASNKVFVGEYTSASAGAAVDVLDGGTGQRITTVTFTSNAGAQPGRVQVSPYSHKAYAAFGSGNSSPTGSFRSATIPSMDTRRRAR